MLILTLTELSKIVIATVSSQRRTLMEFMLFVEVKFL